MHLLATLDSLARNLLNNPEAQSLFKNLPHLPVNSPIHVALVPEPATWGVAAGVVVLVMAIALRRRDRRTA